MSLFPRNSIQKSKTCRITLNVEFCTPVLYFIENIIKKMLDLGISGWMADFGEYLPVDAKMWNNQTGEEVHNQWPVLWARVNREAVEEAGKLGEVVYWMRAGFTGIH